MSKKFWVTISHFQEFYLREIVEADSAKEAGEMLLAEVEDDPNGYIFDHDGEWHEVKSVSEVKE